MADGGEDSGEGDANWRHVLGLLGTDNDSVRFAGLLLVTKCVSPDDHAKREQVFAAIGGVEFLLRLLLPLRAGRVHPQPVLEEEEVERQVQLAGLGLSVVSNLCLSQAVARAEGMARVAEVALGVMRHGPERMIREYVHLEATGEDTGEDTGEGRGQRAGLRLGLEVQSGMVRDACDAVYLIGVGVDERAAVASITFVSGCVNGTVNGTANGTVNGTVGMDGEVALTCLRSVLRCCLQARSAPVRVVAEVVERLFLVGTRSQPQNSSLSRASGDRSDSWLGWALEVLAFLDQAGDRGMLDALEDDAALGIRDGLRALFATRPPEAPLYQALRLVTRLAGRSMDWLVEDMTFFQVVVQMVRVEIGVLMLDAVKLDAVVPELQRLEIGMDDRVGEADGPALSPGPTRLAKDRALKNLPVCFELFELLVEGLCDASAIADETDTEADATIGRIFEALTESAELMLQFVELETGNDDVGKIGDGVGGSDDAMELGTKYRELLRLGAFRGFCSYASQNPLQFQDRLLRAVGVNEFPVRLALPALYGIAVVHGRPLTDPSIVLKLMDEAACMSEFQDWECQPEDTCGEVLLEVTLAALRHVNSQKLLDGPIVARAGTYAKEFPVERALAASSSADEKVAALAVTAHCFVLCRNNSNEQMLRRLVEACLPDLLDEIFSTDGDKVRISPLVQEMFDGLLSSCEASTDIARIELAGNTLVDLCAMFKSEVP